MKITELQTLYARYRSTERKLTVDGIPAVTYTGKAQTPAVTVYNGRDKLVTGKGDFASTIKIPVQFRIYPVITYENDMDLRTPPVELVEGIDYKVAFKSNTKISGGRNVPIEKTTVLNVGSVIKVTATAAAAGNYQGSLSAEYSVIDKNENINNYIVNAISKEYTGDAITLNKSEILLKENKRAVDVLAPDQFQIVPRTRF